MNLSSLFDRVTSALMARDDAPADDAAEKQLVADMIELVVEIVDARIRLKSRYAERLEGCVRTTIAHLREIGRQPLEPLLLTRAGWSDDPRLNSFFVSADDVPAFLGQSKELRTFFSVPLHREGGEAYALLAMKMTERNVLGHQQEGDRVLHDVPQVTVGFSGHKLFAPASTLEETRMEVGRRIISRLGQMALKRIVEIDMKVADLGERKAWLAARLRLVKLAVDGAAGLLEDNADTRQRMAALERELQETVHDYIEKKASVATLDQFIRHVKAIFDHPDEYVTLRQAAMRLSRLGVKLNEGDAGPANEFTLSELVIGDGIAAAIAIVRCPLAEMPPETDPLANAERYI